MRALVITGALCLAATAASAGSDNPVVSRGNIALSNGCVYAPHPSGQSNSWALAYTKSGTTARCALTVKAQARQVSANSRSKSTGLSLDQGFGTGAFR